jgi:hypothetical protein
MICSLSKDDKNYSVYLKLYKHLSAELNKIANTPSATLNITDLMKEMYNDVFNKTQDHELAIRFSRMIPTIVLNVAVKDTSLLTPLMQKGLSLDQTGILAAKSMDPVKGIEYIETELGISKDILNEAKDAIEGSVPPLSIKKIVENNKMPEGQVPGEQTSFNFDEKTGEVQVVDVTEELGEEDIIYPEDKVFEAVAPHVLKDTDQEALSMDKNNSKFNVIDPAKKFFYKVKRKIISLLEKGDKSSTMSYPGVGPVFLKAQSSTLLPKGVILSTTTPVILLVVDKNGKAVSFDEEGNVSKDGKIAFFNMRTPFNIDGKYEQERIKALANTHKISFPVAKKVISKERELVEKVLDYVSKDVNNSVTMDITGGTLGHLGNQPNSYLISKVALGTAVFDPKISSTNEYYFKLTGTSDDTIRISKTDMSDNTEMAQLLADYLVEDVYDRHGVKITPMEKKAMLNRYIVVDSRRLTVQNAGVKLLGNFLDTSSKEAKEKSKEQIKDYFTKLVPFSLLDMASVNTRVKNGAKIVTSIDQAQRGDILKSKAENDGSDVYQLLTYVTLNITNEGLQSGIHIELTENAELGGMTVNFIPNGYRNIYIKNNFKIDKLLNSENQLVALNAYMTFTPLAYETGKIDDLSVEKVEEEVDDFTAELQKMKKAEADAYKKLPAEVKESMAIGKLAADTLPVNGVLSQQVAVIFENNLKAAAYDRVFAEKILEDLITRYKLSPDQIKIRKEQINKYTKPVQQNNIEYLGNPVVSKVDDGDLYQFKTQDGLIGGVMISPTEFRIDGISAYKVGEGQGLKMFEALIAYLKTKGVTTLTTQSAGEGAVKMHNKAVDKGLLIKVKEDGRFATFTINNTELAALGTDAKADIERRRQDELTELGQKQLTKGFNSLSEATKPEQVANAIVNIEQNKNQGALLSKEQEQTLSEARAKLKEQGYEIVDYNIVKYGENTLVEDVDFYNSEKDVLTEEQANAIESRINSLEKRGEEVNVDDLPSPVSRTIKPLIKKDGKMVQAAEVNTLKFESVEQAREAIKKSREAGNKKPNAADKINAKYDAELAATESNEIQDPLTKPTVPDSTTEKIRKREVRKVGRNKIDLTDTDTPIDRVDDDEVFFKMVAQQSDNPVATLAQIKAAKEWFDNHPVFSDPRYGKTFSFREMFNLVNTQNPGSVASWSMNGITLWKGADYSDLYHEAWHGFTQAFMTESQRTELYSEVRRKAGTFKTYEGKTVNFRNAKDKEIEEWLAEDFRSYMLTGRKSKTGQPKRNTFFQKVLNVLEMIFGDLTVSEIRSGDRVNDSINEIYEKLRVGNFDGYNFNKNNVRFNSLDKGPMAVSNSDNLMNLNNKDTKLLMDSMDGWIAQIIDAANSGMPESAFEEFSKKQIDMYMGKLTPEQMEQAKLEMAPKLTYSQTALFLKSQQGRQNAYKIIQGYLAKLTNAIAEEEMRETDPIKKDALRKKHALAYWATFNYGDVTNIMNNKADKDGVMRGVIGYHMEKSKDFGTKVIDLLDTNEVQDNEVTSTSPYADRSGNDTSLKELAKSEVVYLFKTILKYDVETGQPKLNDLGAPELMDFAEVWNKVAIILENERDAVKMYGKLLAYAQQEDQNQSTYAIRQLLNKLGPRGLSSITFPHLKDKNAQNLWTNFWTVFSTRRIPLIAQSIEFGVDKTTNKVTSMKSTIGRGINPNVKVGKAWNSKFKWDLTNPYVDNVDGIPTLNLEKILDKYNYKNVTANNGELVIEFLHAIGVDLTDNADIRRILKEGDADLGIQPDYHVIKTLLMPSGFRVSSDVNTKNKWNSADKDFRKSLSLLESIKESDLTVFQPEDLFSNIKVPVIGGYVKENGNMIPLTMSKLEGEMKNWQALMALEGYYGQGIMSFMVTTAEGNTQFEHSLNSTMSIEVTSINEAKDYNDLILMPHMAKFDISKNPNAKRYAWLNNMFELNVPTSDSNYGKRKETKGVTVKLDLFNLSGTKLIDKDGVSSASADPFTKFILDIHLATQKGLPELMRHSDKGSSYSVSSNYTIDPYTGESIKGAMYVPNTAFLNNRNEYNARAFENYILPNIISEQFRVRKMIDRKAQIDKTLVKIAKERKAGKQITATPVFDFEYLKRGQEFIAFQGVLTKGTKKALAKIKDFESYINDTSNPEAVALRSKLMSETQDYFEKEYNEIKALYDKGGLISDNHIEDVIREYGKTKPDFETSPSTEKVIDAILNSFVYNSWIHNIESMNFLYGDIAIYNHSKEEFHKRNSGIASTGTGYRTDQDMLDFINNEVGRGFEEKLTGNARLYDGTMDTGVMQDKVTRSAYLEEIGFNLFNQMKVKAMRNRKQSGKTEAEIDKELKFKLFGKEINVSTIKALEGVIPEKGSIMYGYHLMEEADGQGWISMDAYRILSYSQGEWSTAQEAMYNAMLAGKEIPGDKIGTFFPPIKAQYFGALKNDFDQNLIAFHKFQLTPIIPTLAVPGSKLEALHNKMMSQGVDYALFHSGSKVSTITSVQFNEMGEPIRDAEGNIKSIADSIYNNDREITGNAFTVNTIYVDYLKNQLKIAPNYKHKITFATQIRKLIEVDLMENGIPTDFDLDSELEDRIEKWHEMSEEEKETSSRNYNQVRDYERAVSKLTEVKMKQLIRRASMTMNADGSLKGDLGNLIKFVKSQLTNQDLADHEIDFIDFDSTKKGLKNDLSFSLSADKIERLLNSIIVKTLVKQKVNGESLIQVSSAMLEGEPQFKKPTKEEILKYGGTNGLTYYRINEEKGIIDAMKVKISIQGDFERLLYLPEVKVMKNKVDAANKPFFKNGKAVQELDYNASLAKLNVLIKDETWLDKGNNRKMVTMHGDRIPIQGMNSDEFAEVYEFLPKEAGNIIILPAETVAKSGGDFDIDKLTLMMPNISMAVTKNANGDTEHTVSLVFKKSEDEYRKMYNQYIAGLVNNYHANADAIVTDDMGENFDAYKPTSEEEARVKKAELVLKHYSLFGGQEKVDAYVAEMLIEEGAAMDFEEFKDLDDEKVAQNDILFAMNVLSSNINNYSNLIRPNATDIFDPIVEKLKKVYRDYDPNFSSNDEELVNETIQGTRLLEYAYNLYKHMTNNFGKAALGIGAIDNTYNELMNRVGMYLVPNNREMHKGIESEDMLPIMQRAKTLHDITQKINEDSAFNKTQPKDKQRIIDWAARDKARAEYTEDDKKALEGFVQQTLHLPHNTMRVKDGQGEWYKDKAISMSSIMDANGENKIGDVISQMMNGWVDVAKKPWIFYVRGDDKLGPMLLFLIQAGVPIEHAVNMISQPVIVDYMETISKLQSQFADGIMDKSADDAEIEKITRDKAILKAKQIMLNKLGYTIKDTGKNKIANLQKTIAEESVYVIPQALDSNGNFSLTKLEEQNQYIYDKYKMFDSKTGQPIPGQSSIDYNDPKINEFQKAIFLHFLQIVDMSNVLKDVKLRTNVDTNKSGTLYDAENKIIQLQELKRAREDSTSQNKFWRIPSIVIDRLIPIIKDADGKDTGRLDTTKAASILSSFYVQPFQLEIWKDLFPLRNNQTINKFLSDLSFNDKDYAKNNTYLATDDKLISEFKNALIPIIFQNTFLGYDLDTQLKESTNGDIYYRGAEIKLDPVQALQMGAVVKYEQVTRNGVSSMQPILYYDYNSLYLQFQNNTYAKDEYGKLGLSLVDPKAFKTFSEFLKFTFEREYLRAQYIGTGSKKSLKALQETQEYKDIKASTSLTVRKNYLKNEDGTPMLDAKGKPKFDATKWNNKRDRVAFEKYIKNKALQNSYNLFSMFNGETAFAYEVMSIKLNEKFKGIEEIFPVLKNLIPDNEKSKASDQERVNLAWLDTPTDSQVIGSYHEQLQDLANEVAIKKAMPNLTRDEIDEIATVFKKLPIVAFLQSGNSTVGKFSLARVIDQDTILSMTEGSVKDFLEKIEKDKEMGNSNTLSSVWKAFVEGNKRYDARGKNYIIQSDGKGHDVSDIKEAMFISSDPLLSGVDRVYDGSFIDEAGIPMDKFSRVGDEIKIIRTIDNVDSEQKAVITSMEWDGSRIIVKVENEKKNKFEFHYNSEGLLKRHVKADSSISENPSWIRASILITEDLISELSGEKFEKPLSKVGDAVDVIFNIKGKPVATPAKIIGIEDMGPSIETNEDGTYYNSDNRFRVKLQNTKDSDKVYYYLVDSEGNVLANIDLKSNVVTPFNYNTKVDISLPQDRMIADYIVNSIEEANELAATGAIPAGSWVDVYTMHPTVKTKIGIIGIIDPVTNTFSIAEDPYEAMEKGDMEFVAEDDNFFLVYNGATSPRGNLAQERSSSTADREGKGKIDFRDRLIHHGMYNNKVGLISRLTYGGGKVTEFITDDIAEDGKATVNPEIKAAIDSSIEQIKIKMAAGQSPRFNKSGYGQYMIGANDTTNEIIGDPIAKETFIYLSKQLLENFGYINPNFIKNAEGIKDVVRVTKQPVSDEQYNDMMNKCFNL